MTPIHLSGDTPRWTPKTEQDIQAAVDGGLIEENHHVDAKREIPATPRKHHNKELARDLASFAVDGGTLIIGLQEDKATQSFKLVPQPLAGLAERVEEVARHVPKPPVSVVCSTVPSAADPTEGYLLIHIPVSPTAPHMVENEYLGRGDKTKSRLSDAEVTRLQRLRVDQEQTVLALLQHAMDRDPIPLEDRQQAHMFLVAQPQRGRPDMLLDLITSDDYPSRLPQVINSALAPEVTALIRDMAEPPPTLMNAPQRHRLADGVSRSTRNIGPGREFTLNGDPNLGRENALELQIREDGGLRLFSSRLSSSEIDDTEEILVETAITQTIRFLALVRAVADESGYTGNWNLAVGGTRLRGLQGHRQFMGATARPKYDEEEYRASGETNWVELAGHPGPIVERLWGRFLRALDADKTYRDVLRPSKD
ncbi:helix-turn-helix domain-containing protein [Embleya sp. NPDC050154]|uniref:helix-turn-helix domain-containing protein n=1 Tax=Embleya sp. NPDC050154 TaxID=3363988 RepID=UPI00379D9598